MCSGPPENSRSSSLVISSGCVRSQTAVVAPTPSFAASSRVDSSPAASWSVSTTLTPSRASAIAIARPIPEAAPVTNAVRPRKVFIGRRLAPLLHLRQALDGRSGCVGEFPGNSARQTGVDPPGERRSGCSPLICDQRQNLIGERIVQDLLEPRQLATDKGGVGDAVIPADHHVDGAIVRYLVIAEDEG